MTHKNDITSQLTDPLFFKRAAIGAAIALALITVFLLQVKYTDPAWPKMWWVRPIIVVPLAGAAGGAFYHLISPLRNRGGWKKVFAIIAGIIVYIFGLWIGTVVGLDGTLWN